MTGRTLVVFDLDDTLYPERSFALSGFRAAADWALTHLGIEGLDGAMTELLDTGHLGPLFGIALKRHRPAHSDAELQALIAAYRDHTPEIRLFDDAKPALEACRALGPIGLITDGTAAVQRSKIRALGLEDDFAHIIATDELGGKAFFKPHPLSYEIMETKLDRTSDDRMFYIGDNPSKDFITPNARGWTSVRIVRENRIHAAAATAEAGAAHHCIHSLTELPDVLRGN